MFNDEFSILGIGESYRLVTAPINEVPDASSTQLTVRFVGDCAHHNLLNNFGELGPLLVPIFGVGIYTPTLAIECEVTNSNVGFVMNLTPAPPALFTVEDMSVIDPDYGLRLSAPDYPLNVTSAAYPLTTDLVGSSFDVVVVLTWDQSGISIDIGGDVYPLSAQPRPAGVGAVGFAINRDLVGSEGAMDAGNSSLCIDEVTVTSGSGPATSFFWRDLERTVEEA